MQARLARFLSALIALGAASTALVAPAAAGGEVATASTAPSGDRSLQSARSHYREALLLRKAGKPEQALAELEAAYAELPTPTLLFTIAELHADLKRPQEGLAALSRYRRQLTPERMPAGQGLAEVEALERRLAVQLLSASERRESTESAAPTQVHPESPVSAAAPQPGPAPSAPEASTVPAAAPPRPMPNGTARFFPGTPTWISAGLTLGSLLATSALAGVAAQRQKECAASFFCSSSSYLPPGTFDSSAATEVSRLKSATWAMLGVSGGLLSITVVTTLIEYSQFKRKRAASLNSAALPAPSGPLPPAVRSW